MTTGVHSPVSNGHHVQGYVLRRFLAQGGMAELFLARPTDPQRAGQVVVVKRVLPQFVQDIQFARMFAREASLASLLKHPNIVEVFGADGVNERECFFAMEYVHGPDLNMLLKQLKDGSRPIPLEHAIQIAMGMCGGLHYAHDYRGEDGNVLGIVHRDVSPSNVMISGDGIVKITDFGVAKALALTSFTQAGTRKGKLSYMSPEQAVADPVDRRTDIFAIGAVLYEMTTLQRMFGGENELAVMHKLLFRERPRPTALRHDYPPELESIVMKAVAQQPSDRFSTAEEMQKALYEFAERRRLLSTPTHLTRWVASVIPPTQHPAHDPSFFSTDDPSGVIPIPRGATAGVADGQATVSDGGLADGATVMDGSSGPPAPVAGQLLPTASTPAAVPPGPAAAAGSFTGAPSSIPSVARPVRRPPASKPSNLPAIAIVAGALALASVILAGALWYADERERSKKGIDDTPAQTDPSEAGAASPDEPALQPGVINPDPVPTPASEAELPSPADPAPATTAETPAPTPTPSTAASKSGKRKKKKAAPRTPKSTTPAPKPAPTPAPTPKPEPAKKQKNKLDELFPSG
ncbi:MAG: protein kinase [Myxococcota bacterium]